MTAPKIRHEASRNGTGVAYVHSFCPACAYWSSFKWTMDAAREAGDRHLMNVHDVSQETISTLRRNRAARARQTTNHQNGSQR